MSAELPGYRAERARRLYALRSARKFFTIVVLVLFFTFLTQYILTAIGPQENFQTLRSDLAKIRLPSGYLLGSAREAGTDCTNRCSLTETWIWTAAGIRTPATACSDARRALAAAFSRVDPNSPIAANATCDYYSVLTSFFHPGQGKPVVDAIVQSNHEGGHGGFVLKLIGSYFSLGR